MFFLSLLQECFTLDPELDSGLRWRKRPVKHFKNQGACNAWNARYVNEPAGTINNIKGKLYWHVTIKYKIEMCHRIVWMLSNNKEVPDGMMVDHWDGDTQCNFPENLRLADDAQNQWNASISKANTSGYKGVSKHSSGNWRATIKIRGKTYNLGYFKSPELASEAYSKAAIKHQQQFAKL